MTTAYAEFLATKKRVAAPRGIDVEAESLNGKLFPFQRAIVQWALRKGSAAIFAECGLGKTPMQLEWASYIVMATTKPVLVLAPLAVASQTCQEGVKFGIKVTHVRSAKEVDGPGIYVTNYDRLHRFEDLEVGGIVLDESSILKAYDGKTRNAIIDRFRDTPYKLACTATPAPNDFMELGNHSEFLAALSRTEMLSMFFVHDGGETQKWRLKGHAKADFWRWMASWSVMVRKPSDLGFDDDEFELPDLRVHHQVVEVEERAPDALFPFQVKDLRARLAARRDSVEERAEQAAKIANATDGPVIVWCNLNTESALATKMIEGAVEVTGSDSVDVKEARMMDFSNGETRVLVSKPSIAGFGMNWQHCSTVIFLGLSDSWESYYQAVRRSWRFGQTRPVDVHIVTASTEGDVVDNIQRKEKQAIELAEEITRAMRDETMQQLSDTESERSEYVMAQETGASFDLRLGDCVDVLREQPSESIHYSVFSPPFASLYTYSDSERDLGNSKTDDEFHAHYAFVIDELFRVLMPGRLVSIHCMNLPTSKARDGYIGIRDFRGDMVRSFESAGFIFHSEVCIWKDPVTAMQRTKALGLLHKQLKKDAAMSRQGIPDYVVTMRKPGDNPEPVSNTNETFPVRVWQNYASPIWSDINPSDTLQYRSAREHDDERHICPLQLTVIRRCIRLWSNEGDLVLSPFAGIGSEGWVALEMGRRFFGIELKRSYFDQAVANLRAAEERGQQQLFQ